MTGWIVFLALVVALSALPRLAEYRRRPVDDALRREAPGRFADLNRGKTHYRWLGPVRGPVALCVHGLTTPSPVWDGLAEELAAMGFRVLVYDLYGRGYSDAPRGAQTAAFHAAQLRELMDREGLTEEVTLIGYSMGGAIAAAFAAEEDHRLRRLILIAPAGMGHELGPLAKWVADWPFVGDWAFHMFWPRQALADIAATEGGPTSVPGIWDLQRDELKRRGFVRSVLSSLRGILRHPLEAEHRTLAASGLPVAAVWARDDAVIPLRAMGQLTQWNRKVRQEVIDGAGHGLVFTHTEELAGRIRAIIADAA
ncbi:alpha/beta hydrolase [Aestuariicoccus sp. MJ-SS9]|uniref:alpha/beta fold hydrolase n=1 Tax=Aestuariicoccus sp. MJ-SS9 TaxID=3079855 RepID=UPI00290D18C8|nr:alpha/beta hydrolase [Aestuariicoccus sp. MJ-SS9]MDU8910723.1 alpha/beta hydrolase [Aestuariicoccus sp. MJ-SS9]